MAERDKRMILSSNSILNLIGNTPLIRLNKMTKGFPGNYYAKWEASNPGHSNKDRIALFIIEEAERKWKIKTWRNYHRRDLW